MYKLYCDDSLEILKDITDKSIDCIITSPPYNIGKDYQVSSDTKDNYIQWITQYLKEFSRVSKCLWINLGYRKLEYGNIPIMFQIWDKVDMFLMQHITWEYDAGMAYTKRFSHRSEDWLWYVDNPKHYIFNTDNVRDINLQRGAFDKRNNPLGKLPGTVWFYNRVPGNSKERFDHPTQYPLLMIERIVKACTNINDTILDPFMGSGTTGIAALKHQRKFIGIDNNPYYYNMSLDRLNNLD
jgi:adenine-specific DNA-methyltransferase